MISKIVQQTMSYKKKFTLILGGCVLVFGVTVGGIVANASGFSRENVYLSNENQDIVIDKESLYSEYVAKTIASKIKDSFEIEDCEINMTYLNGEFVFADISVVTENDEVNDLETNILDYVSETLGISTQYISITFN